MDRHVRVHVRRSWAQILLPRQEFVDPAPVTLKPDQKVVLTGAKVEPSLAGAAHGARYQFERLGYFCVDPDSTPDQPVLNRTVTLRDTWARIQKQKNQQKPK